MNVVKASEVEAVLSRELLAAGVDVPGTGVTTTDVVTMLSETPLKGVAPPCHTVLPLVT